MNQYSTIHVAALTGTVSAGGVSDNGNSMSLLTYDNLPGFLEKYGHELVEGAWVADLTPLKEDPHLFKKVWDCPLPNLKLPPGEINRWNGKEAAGSFAPVIAANYFGEAGAVAAVTTTTDEPGPFDYVSPDLWAKYWFDNGGKIGRWIAGKVIWG